MNDSLDVLVYSIAEYFYSFRIVAYFDLPCGVVKVRGTTRENTQRCYTPKFLMSYVYLTESRYEYCPNDHQL